MRPLLFLVAALALCAGAVLLFWRVDRVVVSPGKLAGGTVQACAPRDGVVTAVLVRAGQAVRDREVLLRLDTRELEAEAASGRARLEGLRGEREARIAERRRLVESVHPREREEAAAVLERARVEEERADIEATAARRLGEQGIVGRIEVRKAELDLQLATMARSRAAEAIALLEAQHEAALEALDAEERRLDGEIEAERIAWEASMSRVAASEVRAPADGTVEGDGLADLVGSAVREGEGVLRVHREAPGRFEGTLADAGRASVRAGQPATIRLEGYPWLIHGTLHGTVARVAERRKDAGGFTVEIGLSARRGGPGPLQEGMSGSARIRVGERVSLGRLLLERVTGQAAP